MRFPDLRSFLAALEARGDLARIQEPVSPRLEFTEIARRVLAREGPALVFERPKGSEIPAVANLFGAMRRILWALGLERREQLRTLGEALALLYRPEMPEGSDEAKALAQALVRARFARPKRVSRAPWREVVLEGEAVDLSRLPIQTCWPGDAGPLITWGVVITRGPHKKRHNLGIYRQQLIGRNKLIMRWLRHRGGAQDHREAKSAGATRFPVAVAIGADPATLLGAVAPVPDRMSEYSFAGLLAGARVPIARCVGVPLWAPASAEIVLEGHVALDETAPEGPFGDHTGYYNEVERFPVFTVERICMRRDPLYLTTYTGKPPDEPAILGLAMNEIFTPLLQRQFPEIVDFHLPMEGCSYRVAVIAIRKAYPGHAKRVMFGLWGFLRQFLYTKFIIVVDDDVDIRSWPDVVWAVSTRADPARDLVVVERTPIDYLDFASPEEGLGGKMGIDATHKWPGETDRAWGVPIAMDQDTIRKVDALWPKLGL
ncbi:MAG: UbiD family decarboxylase [Zetaproteobacteria bacterium]|nr:MAG: UbiD family decarboxylase [Zetaproteobacteria bacterium]